MELFQILLPKKEICGERALYYRASPPGAVLEEEDGAPRLVLAPGGRVALNTYFNLFSCALYRAYTRVRALRILLSLRGDFVLRLFGVPAEGGPGGAALLGETAVSLPGGGTAGLSQDLYEITSCSHLYVELEAKSEGAVFLGGSYRAEIPENPVHIAAVICTYRREAFVYRNMRNAARAIYAPPGGETAGCLDFLIVDNGRTIEAERLPDGPVRVFPNKNAGGSAGFTRGIIEAWRRRDRYTHVLLMDDDILFEPNVLVKTASFLKAAKRWEKPLCVGAGMLREDIPWLQHEAGARYRGGRAQSLKAGLDLREPASLLENERPEPPDYSGWWYLCMPLSVVERHGLPLPFFIKMDDVEYGLRTGGDIVLLNGVGVWHNHFDFKYNAQQTYYDRRNEMVLKALCRNGDGVVQTMLQFARSAGKRLFTQRYPAFDLLCRAYEDYLKGVDFFLQTDAEALNGDLLRAGIAQYDDGELLRRYGVSFDRSAFEFSKNQRLGRAESLLQKITLNGYLLPRAFYRKTTPPYRVVDMTSCTFANFFMADRVLQYNEKERRGFVSRLKKSELPRVCVKTAAIAFKMLLRYRRVSRQYRARARELTGMAFWRRYLELPPEAEEAEEAGAAPRG